MTYAINGNTLKFPNPTQVYVDLLDTWKSKARPIVIWAGAGLSAPANLPSWPTLQNKLHAEAKRYVSSLSDEQQKEKSTHLKALSSISNPWIAFEKLELILGPNNFQAEIKRALNGALKCSVPPVYIRLWELGVSGFLTLNIDRLVSRAFAEASLTEPLVERSGFDIKALIGNINAVDRGRFIANLHGVFEEPPTWVFTDSKKKALFADQRYQEFVRDILKYCTVVMLGVSANDSAIRDHLTKLKSDGILGTHTYWISSETGTEALSLAEQSGIRFISYRNTDGIHNDLLNFLDDVQSFTSTAIDAPPVTSINKNDRVIQNDQLPELKDLLILTPNEQREILNSHASKILSTESEDSYEEFESFCQTYNRAIHAAGLFETEQGSDQVLNYTLTNLEDREGGFGTIWRACDENGDQFAIKVFKHEIRKNQNLLKAFRRGVRSLKILAKHKLPGIVEFKTACEIPPILVMEWIEGANLYTAVTQGKLKDWGVRLRIARDLANAIYSAHSVPERVLHRDIKPQNIMLRDFFQEGENAEIVVLDFDLSWHVGALEKSVLATSINPYLAPEQLIAQSEMTSRSAAVDAYGFGMTLYFLCTGTVPTPFMHESAEWSSKLNTVAAGICKSWRSAPRRISRLIDLCTKHDQNERPSFSQITADITRLQHIVQGDLSHIDMQLLCEELAARTETLENYQVSRDGSIHWESPTRRLRATIKPSGVERLTFKFEFIQTGNEQFNSLANASDLITHSHTHFPQNLIDGTPINTQQHGHYMNEFHLAIDMLKIDTQIVLIQKGMSSAMDRLMASSQ